MGCAESLRFEGVEKPPQVQATEEKDRQKGLWCLLADFTFCWPQISNGKNVADASGRRGRKGRRSVSEQSLYRSDIKEQSQSKEKELASSRRLRRFCFTDLQVATRNFRPDSLLGKGGFGCVFKGWIDEHGTTPAKPGTGLTVAVKILDHCGLQGHKEWLAEVTFLGQLQHPNLVKLIGFCIEGEQRLLVYEFMERGSLENHLFRKVVFSLPWNVRMKIMLGAAKGLEFLHNGKRPIIYRDFKAANVLLDIEFNAKLSDFGLAKDGPEGDNTHVSTRVMGTHGYAAPEYVMSGHLGTKSDVYSFGIVLIEVITGRRCMDKARPIAERHLAEWARPFLMDKSKLLDIVDPRLEGKYSIKGLERAGYLASCCIKRDPKLRLSMSEVVQILDELQGNKDMVNILNPFNGSDKDTAHG